jgi:hypothetical protein
MAGLQDHAWDHPSATLLGIDRTHLSSVHHANYRKSLTGQRIITTAGGEGK